MSGSPLDAYRQTLRRLLEDRAGVEAKLQRITAAIQAVAEYLPESERVQFLGDEEEIVGETEAPPPRFPPNTTMADAAETVLRAIGRAMKARDVVRTLRAWGYPYRKDDDAFHASLGGVLARKAGQGEVFTKLEPGTFGLLEWEAEDEAAAVAEPYTAVADDEPQDEGEPTDEDEEDLLRPLKVTAGRGDYDDFQPPPFGDEDDDLPF